VAPPADRESCAVDQGERKADRDVAIINSVLPNSSDGAVVMRWLNGWLTIVWIIMVPVSYFAHWLDSVTYVSALSLWALVSGHWAAWQAARVEVHQNEDANVAEALEILERLEQRFDDLERSWGSGAHRAT
jgi:hypothetical protein